jgi:hypothetical protein
MTQQSLEAVQRRRTLTTLGFLGALVIAAALALFASPGATQVAPEPATKPPVTPPVKPAASARAKLAAPTERAPAKPAKPAPPLVDEQVLWDDPPEWKRLPSSGMRYASYQIPAAKGETVGGELNVFILGGDVEANIQRWIGEFSNFDLKTVVRSQRKVHELEQTIVEIPRGRFDGGMGEGKASDNYGLLGAIVVAPSGAEFFFKLTGPSKAVKAARKPFYQLLDSVHAEKGAAASAATPAARANAAAAPPANAAAPPASGSVTPAPHP